MFFDTDCGGVIHNLAYLRMIETCRTRLAAQLGMQLREMAESQLFPVLVRTEVNYIRPGKLGDWLEITGQVIEVGRAKFTCELSVIRESDRQTLATARQVLALVQMPEGKPRPLPANFRELCGL